MAASSLLALIDDIAGVLDDVATMTKVATRKTAGVLGDDLALNAQQVTGVAANRELPVVWAVAKGSFVNKSILVPAALAISAFVPWAVTPLLMIGGLFLCYEGFEKIVHRWFAPDDESRKHRAHHVQAIADASVDLVALERDRIKGAVRTDFILSAEIIAITLGTVAGAPFATRVGVLVGVAVIMTVGVYGIVAGIVKLDDAGLHLSRRPEHALLDGLQRALGRGILRVSPWLMKTLSVAGTAAMFLVGGGILTHGVPRLHHWIEAAAATVGAWPGVGTLLEASMPPLLDAATGMAAGALCVLAVALVRRAAAGGRSTPGAHGPND